MDVIRQEIHVALKELNALVNPPAEDMSPFSFTCSQSRARYSMSSRICATVAPCAAVRTM